MSASERLIYVCSELGLPKKGKRIVYTPSDPKVEDLVLLLTEEEAILSEVIDLTIEMEVIYK